MFGLLPTYSRHPSYSSDWWRLLPVQRHWELHHEKNRPRSPPILCTRPDLPPAEALRHAEEYLRGAICGLKLLPEQALSGNQPLLSDVLLDLKICKAMLTVAMTGTTEGVPIQ